MVDKNPPSPARRAPPHRAGFTWLDIRELGHGQWMLIAPLRFTSDTRPPVTVPRRFLTDLFSIPRLCRPLLASVQQHNAPAVLHDWLYKSGNIGATQIGRADADAYLLDGMAALGFEWWRRRLIYTAVRLGGWPMWNHYRNATPYLGPT